MLPACRRCRNRVAGSAHAIPSNSRMADIEIEVISSCSFEAFPKLPEIFYTNVIFISFPFVGIALILMFEDIRIPDPHYSP